MDFTTLALQELTALADRLSAASARDVEAASQQLSESFQATIDGLRQLLDVGVIGHAPAMCGAKVAPIAATSWEEP